MHHHHYDYITDLQYIAAQASEREEENDHFLRSLQHHTDEKLDGLAHSIYEEVNSAIDCTACGNCCRGLVINVTHDEVEHLAALLHMTEEHTKDEYIEESQQGNCFINTIPCHFLSNNMCSIYEHRFTECRDFPHLHKPGFRARFPGTLMHYGRCPIIYNVVEGMKTELGFTVTVDT